MTVLSSTYLSKKGDILATKIRKKVKIKVRHTCIQRARNVKQIVKEKQNSKNSNCILLSP
jgi:hypothetical protein